MSAAPAPAIRPGSQLVLVAARTRLGLVVGGAAGFAAAIYTAIHLVRTASPVAVSAGQPALVALLLPPAIALPALATLVSFRYLSGRDAGWTTAEGTAGGVLGWLNRLVYGAITGVACGWAVWLLIVVLTPVLSGAAAGKPALVAATGLCAGLLAGAIAFASAAVSRRGLLIRLGLMIGLGLLLAVLLTQDMRWWRDSLSYMGRAGSAARVFSVTMVLAGLGLCGVFLEMGAGLRRLGEMGWFPPRSAALLTVLLVVASLGLIGVGVFPSNDDPVSLALHKLTGNGGLALFIGVMLALRWLAPPFGSTAHLASGALGVLSICALGLNAANVLSFVWFELIDIALLMTWLLLFEAYCRSLIGDCSQVASGGDQAPIRKPSRDGSHAAGCGRGNPHCWFPDRYHGNTHLVLPDTNAPYGTNGLRTRGR
jgi:hypothetical membrane protein